MATRRQGSLPSTKTILARLAIALAVVGVLVVVGVWAGDIVGKAAAERENNAAYARGEQLIEDGRYLEAALEFEALGDFRDAPARVDEAYELQSEARYARAGELFDNGEYDRAAREFAALQGFRDAAAHAEAARLEKKATDYGAADELSRLGDHVSASVAFWELGEYRDAASRANEEQWEAVRAGATEGLELHFGSYNGGDLVWKVAEVEDDRALLVATTVLACPAGVELPCAWDGCLVQEWLVGDFLTGSFTPDEAAMLVDAGQGTVFLCTADELVGYVGDAAQRQGIDWRLDREGLLGGKASYIYVNATHYTYDRDLLEKQVGVRPLVWVRLPTLQNTEARG